MRELKEWIYKLWNIVNHVHKGLVLVRISMVVVALLVLSIIFLSIVPLLQGGIKVELPEADQIEWSYNDTVLTSDLNINVYNGGYLSISDFRFWVEINVNKSEYFVQSDSVSVSLKGHQWTEVHVPVNINLGQIDAARVEEMLFDGAVLRINGGMTTYAAANLVHLSAQLIHYVNYSLPSVVSVLNLSAEKAQLHQKVQGWELQVPYALNSTQLGYGWNATLEYHLHNSTAVLGEGNKTFVLGEGLSDNLSFPISNQTAERLSNGTETLFFDLTLDLGLASRNFTFSTDWTGNGSGLTSTMPFAPMAQEDQSPGIEVISIDRLYEIPSWERVVMP